MFSHRWVSWQCKENNARTSMGRKYVFWFCIARKLPTMTRRYHLGIVSNLFQLVSSFSWYHVLFWLETNYSLDVVNTLSQLCLFCPICVSFVAKQLSTHTHTHTYFTHTHILYTHTKHNHTHTKYSLMWWCLSVCLFVCRWNGTECSMTTAWGLSSDAWPSHRTAPSCSHQVNAHTHSHRNS